MIVVKFFGANLIGKSTKKKKGESNTGYVSKFKKIIISLKYQKQIVSYLIERIHFTAAMPLLAIKMVSIFLFPPNRFTYSSIDTNCSICRLNLKISFKKVVSKKKKKSVHDASFANNHQNASSNHSIPFERNKNGK